MATTIIQTKDVTIDTKQLYTVDTVLNGVNTLVINAPIKAKGTLILEGGTVKINAPIKVDGLLVIDALDGQINANVEAKYIGLAGHDVIVNQAKIKADKYVVFDLEHSIQLLNNASVKMPTAYVTETPELGIPASIKTTLLTDDLSQYQIFKDLIKAVTKLGPVETASVLIKDGHPIEEFSSYNLEGVSPDSPVYAIVAEILRDNQIASTAAVEQETEVNPITEAIVLPVALPGEVVTVDEITDTVVILPETPVTSEIVIPQPEPSQGYIDTIPNVPVTNNGEFTILPVVEESTDMLYPATPEACAPAEVEATLAAEVANTTTLDAA